MKTLLAFGLIFSFSISNAEIIKTAVPDDKCGGFCFYWWPKLPEIKGWHQDKSYSFHYRANTQAPDGFNFANAESVIYAKAMYKPRMPNTKTLNQFIAEDHLEFKSQNIKQTTSIKSKDNKAFSSYLFTPKSKGNWEQVSYSEDSEYYIVFTLSSRSKSSFDTTQKTYINFIEQYN